MNDALKKILKETGIKMGKYDNDKNRLYHMSKGYLLMLKLMVKEAEDLRLTNEQFWIDFEDELNEISIKDHLLINIPEMNPISSKKILIMKKNENEEAKIDKMQKNCRKILEEKIK